MHLTTLRIQSQVYLLSCIYLSVMVIYIVPQSPHGSPSLIKRPADGTTIDGQITNGTESHKG